MRSQNPSGNSSDTLNRCFQIKLENLEVRVKLENLEVRKVGLPPLLLSKRVTAVKSVPSAVGDGFPLRKTLSTDYTEVRQITPRLFYRTERGSAGS
jgi:hypothetical protein